MLEGKDKARLAVAIFNGMKSKPSKDDEETEPSIDPEAKKSAGLDLKKALEDGDPEAIFDAVMAICELAS